MPLFYYFIILPTDVRCFIPAMDSTYSSQLTRNDATLNHILAKVSVPPYQCVLGTSQTIHSVLADIEVCRQRTEVCFEGLWLLPSERKDHFALSTRDRLLMHIRYFNMRIRSLTTELQFCTDLYLFRVQESQSLQEYNFQRWWTGRFSLCFKFMFIHWNKPFPRSSVDHSLL